MCESKQNVIMQMTSKLMDIYEDWMAHREWWFRCVPEVDALITKKYQPVLDSLTNTANMEAVLDLVRTTRDLRLDMGWIILCDQIPRHTYRTHPAKASIISLYLAYAVEHVDFVIDTYPLDKFTGIDWGFLMLPWRHTNEFGLVMSAMQLTWRKIHIEKQLGRFAVIEDLKPFLKATYARCPMMTDTYRDFWEHEKNACEMDAVAVAEIEWDRTPYLDVLEYAPGTHDITSEEKQQLSSLPIYKTLQNSLRSQVGHNQKLNHIIVSLSGGVDSMVALAILSMLSRQAEGGHWTFEALHINYCNRDDIEEEFVLKWCACNGIDVTVRRIREIQRGPAMDLDMRNVYETYTRDVRFHSYKRCASERANGGERPIVLLGHNADDCFENIITNLCHKQKYEELAGMVEWSETSDVRFWRPFIGNSKQDIYQFAKLARIPYLHDSTPSWSCRGKIRDVVRPTLVEFNPEMVESLFHLRQTMKDLMANVLATAIEASKRTKVTSFGWSLEMGDSNSTPRSLLTSNIFWQAYFSKLWGIEGVVSIRSLKNYCLKLQAFIDQESTKMKVVLVKGRYAQVIKKKMTTPGDGTVFEFQFHRDFDM